MKKYIAVAIISLVACFVHPAWTIVLCAALIALAHEIYIENKYKKGTYYKDTKLPYREMKADSGRYGEYLIYKNLQHREGVDGKFLFNAYIPTEDGNTTEIDVMFLCRKGIFVFESKNYSGWIFGNESHRNWTQTLPKGRSSHKEHFYNPIKQNAGHIKSLKRFVSENVRFYSVITFSDRCTIKELEVHSQNVFVLHRRQVESSIAAVYQHYEDVITQEELETLYGTLYPFTQVSEDVKRTHVEELLRGTKEYVPAFSAETCENGAAIEENSVEQPENEKMKKKESTDGSMCPWCQGSLILRTARRGERAGKSFYGCENYPKCRYIRNIDE